MRFEWDERKSSANFRKHGLTFKQATQAFSDPLRVTEWDQDVDGEERWKTFGVVRDVLLLVVVHTIQEADETILRLISARKASHSERRLYEEENG